MNKKFIIAGGGTGGHIFPAVAIANALKRIDPAYEILFIGAKGKMEMEKIPQAGYEIVGIDIAGFNRSSLLKNIFLPFKVLRSFIRVSRIMRSFDPVAVVGVGGYSTFPVLRYAQSKRIPTFIHESNAFAGKTNMMLARKARKVFTAGEGMEKFFPADKIMVTGNPIRREIAGSTLSRQEASAYFHLDPELTTILVTGGSQGARSINEAIAASVEAFAENNLQLIWQTGKLFASRASELSDGKKNMWTGEFISKMEYAFAASDIVVSRAGAMAISELSVMKKPVILVPLPTAAEDHQTANAKRLVENDAGLLIADASVQKDLTEAIISLAGNKQQQEKLKSNIGKFATVNADEVIAREIVRMINE